MGTWQWKVWLHLPQLLKVGVAADGHTQTNTTLAEHTCGNAKEKRLILKGKSSKSLETQRICEMKRKGRRVGVFMHETE